MLHYGSDKPDMRYDLLIQDATKIFAESNFSIFVNQIKMGSIVRAIPAPDAHEKSRSFFDNMIEFAKTCGAGGLAYIIWGQDGVASGPIAKLLTQDQLNELKALSKIDKGAVFLACGEENFCTKLSGLVRAELASRLELINKGLFRFCWVVDFPYFELDSQTKKLDFNHNPFSMPQGGLEALESADTIQKQLDIKAYQYDLVCNGIELSSGAIRNHKPEIMYKAFEMVGYSHEEVDDKFGGMIKALAYGAPPHGGIAPGIDRIVMLLADEPNIREIIAFPMNQQAQDLLMNAPNQVSEKHLKELGITHVKKAK